MFRKDPNFLIRPYILFWFHLSENDKKTLVCSTLENESKEDASKKAMNESFPASFQRNARGSEKRWRFKFCQIYYLVLGL